MRFLFIALFLACATLSAAQTNLDALPKAERDSTLVAIVQKLLRAKFPAYYRENIRPEITERKYAPSPKDSVPEGVTPGEPCYHVKLHYDNWAAEAAFEDSYTPVPSCWLAAERFRSSCWEAVMGMRGRNRTR